MTVDLFNEPDSGHYAIVVVWPDGQRVTYEGIGLTAEQIAQSLTELAATLSEEVRTQV